MTVMIIQDLVVKSQMYPCRLLLCLLQTKNIKWIICFACKYMKMSLYMQCSTCIYNSSWEFFVELKTMGAQCDNTNKMDTQHKETQRGFPHVW